MRFTSTPRGARLPSHRLDERGYGYGGEINEAVTAIVGELAASAVRHCHVPGRDFALRLTVPGAGGTLRFRVEVSGTRSERLPTVTSDTSGGGAGEVGEVGGGGGGGERWAGGEWARAADRRVPGGRMGSGSAVGRGSGQDRLGGVCRRAGYGEKLSRRSAEVSRSGPELAGTAAKEPTKEPLRFRPGRSECSGSGGEGHKGPSRTRLSRRRPRCSARPFP